MLQKYSNAIHPIKYDHLEKGSDVGGLSIEDEKIKSESNNDEEILAYDIGLLLDNQCKGFIQRDDLSKLIKMLYDGTENYLLLRALMIKVKNENEIISFKYFSEQLSLNFPNPNFLREIRKKIFKNIFPKFCFNFLLSMRERIANSSLLKIKNSRSAEKSQISPIFGLLFSYLQAADYWSDVYILYQIYNIGRTPENYGSVDFTILFIVRLLAVTCHYLIAYSSGIQLMIKKGYYDPIYFKNRSPFEKFGYACFLHLSALYFSFIWQFLIYFIKLHAVLLYFIGPYLIVIAPHWWKI